MKKHAVLIFGLFVAINIISSAVNISHATQLKQLDKNANAVIPDIATGKSIKLSGPSGGSEHDYNREPTADKKLILYWFVLPILLLIGVLAILSYFSRRPGNVGLYDNKLKHCQSKKNCVCSEFILTEGGDKKSAIDPIAMDKLDDQVWEKIKQIILASGGKIMKDDDKYIWATFRTRIFRFTDDLEIRLDKHNHVLHIRSASRVLTGEDWSI